MIVDIDAIVAQLQAHTDCFTFIGGAAVFANAVDAETINPKKLPAAFVVPMATETDGNVLMTGSAQTITTHIAIFVILDNSADREGQAAGNAVFQIQANIRKAILNWKPDATRGARGFAEGKSYQVAMNLARLTWVFEYNIQTTVDNTDGFIEDSMPLSNVTVTTGNPFAVDSIAIPTA